MSLWDDRPGTYDPVKVWDEETETWVANDGRGGARYGIQLVVIGYDDDGNGVIYFSG